MYQQNGRYHFNNGISHSYARPHITSRHYDYRYAPRPIVESYNHVDGYTWNPGQWQWNGYEWIWAPGFYQPAY